MKGLVVCKVRKRGKKHENSEIKGGKKEIVSYCCAEDLCSNCFLSLNLEDWRDPPASTGF